MKNKTSQLSIEQDFNNILENTTNADGVTIRYEDNSYKIDTTSGFGDYIFGFNNDKLKSFIEELEQTQITLATLSSKLTGLLPKILNHVFYADSTEANFENALNIALKYWEQNGEGSKNTFICIGQNPAYQEISATSGFNLEYLDFPDSLIDDPSYYKKEDEIIDKLEDLLNDYPDKYAGVIVQPLVYKGEDFRICSEEFMQKLQWSHRQFDTLLIFDETHTGFGKTGDIFACLKTQVEPDIICLSKGLTAGISQLSACAFSDAIFAAIGENYTPNKLYTPGKNEVIAGVANLKLLASQSSSFLTLEKTHQSYIEKLKSNAIYSNFRHKGNIVGIDVEADLNQFYDYVQSNQLIIELIGNTLVLNPALVIDNSVLEKIYSIFGNFNPS